MLIEQRLIWVDQIGLRRSINADIISFGSESCVIPFLAINDHWATFMQLFDLGIRLKLVTPRIAQTELSDIVNLLRRITTVQKPLDIVINDWGLLQFCTEHSDCLNIHIGRQLCRSLLDCPWHDEILKNENNDVREIISLHPYNNTEKLKALQAQGIKGLEINALFRGVSLQHIIDFNLEIAVHCETYLLTCGRTCLAKKVVSDRTCRDICEKKFQLEPSGKWLTYFENREPFSDYESSMVEGLSISGKNVTLPQKLCVDDMLSCDVKILIATEESTINHIQHGRKDADYMGDHHEL